MNGQTVFIYPAFFQRNIRSTNPASFKSFQKNRHGLTFEYEKSDCGKCSGRTKYCKSKK